MKQYANGRCNLQFLPDVERDADGRWLRITGVRTSWRGFDADEVNLKIRRNENAAERTRIRALSPGIVDMELLTDWWLEGRPHRLAAAGVLESVEAFDPDQDRSAFFVSTHSTSPYGDYSDARLSKRFGMLLHRVMRKYLGRQIATWTEIQESKELRRKWRGLFGAHSTRQLLVTYLGGIRDMWTLAARLTNDRIATLQQYYLQYEGEVAEASRLSGIDNPRHFDAVVDLLLAGKVVDWETFDPEAPEDVQVIEKRPAA